MRKVLHLSLPFTLVSSFFYKIVQYGSNTRFMIVLRLCCHWPCVRILRLPTTDHECGNSALVNTRCIDSRILAQMYPLKSVPLSILPLPFWTFLPWSKLRLNLVYTLSNILLIPQLVMSPLYPLRFSCHPLPPSVPPFWPPSCTSRTFMSYYCTSPKPCISILQYLRTKASMPGRRNILKKLNYDTLQIGEVNFVLPRFDENLMFVLPPIVSKSMDGMDKRYDNHVSTKTQTTNISNDLGRWFSLVHLRWPPWVPQSSMRLPSICSSYLLNQWY